MSFILIYLKKSAGLNLLEGWWIFELYAQWELDFLEI